LMERVANMGACIQKSCANDKRSVILRKQG
jgi:hypothetical protein